MPQNPFLEKEYKTIKAMISLYCRELHARPKDDLCPSCRELLVYAQNRLDQCPFGEDKPVCSKCRVHCYRPERRRQIRQVMRYAGPRIMRSHPLLAARHLLQKLKKPKALTP